MAKGAKPFRYRGKWRAQVTLSNGSRPHCDFPEGEHDAAVKWIAAQLTEADSEHVPELGGPTQATLADALKLYAELYTINKGGATSELNRINHYLEAAGIPPLKLVKDAEGRKTLQAHQRRALPAAFQQHNDKRRVARDQTYKQLAVLANKTCNSISTADLRRLVAAMESENLSPSYQCLGSCGSSLRGVRRRMARGTSGYRTLSHCSVFSVRAIT
ncbi:MAG: hypothetical protein JO269_12595 [Burkholderiaceae bacterium]|nr:hypothetical protein [Burkholderiaceae bacterium]